MLKALMLLCCTYHRAAFDEVFLAAPAAASLAAAAGAALQAVLTTYQELLATDTVLMTLALTMWVMDVGAQWVCKMAPRLSEETWRESLSAAGQMTLGALQRFLLYALIVLAGVMLANGLKRAVWESGKSIVILDKLVVLGVAALSAHRMLTHAGALDLFGDVVRAGERIKEGKLSEEEDEDKPEAESAKAESAEATEREAEEAQHG